MKYETPQWTYETLDAELYNKGHGKIMDSRKVGNHTWLKRNGLMIVVQLHDTAILTYHPDNRVTLNASHWTTVTTKDRMNAFLGWNSISSERGTWYVNVVFHVKHKGTQYSGTRRIGEQNHETSLIEARIPFENYMTLDVHTHALVSHPNERFTRVDDSLLLREATDLGRILSVQARSLEEQMREGSTTKDEIKYTLEILAKYHDDRKLLEQRIQSLARSMDWSATRLEELIQEAMREHASRNTQEEGTT